LTVADEVNEDVLFGPLWLGVRLVKLGKDIISGEYKDKYKE